EVDGRPGGQYLRTGRLLRRHHFAGVDADPDADLEVPQMGHMLVQLGERGAHVDGREHGAQWIVLTYHWDPEHSHDGVSDELLDHATATDQAIVHQREVTRHQVVDYLGVEALAQLGGVGQVTEQDGNCLAHLPHAGVVHLGPAAGAEAAIFRDR